jgi:leader peptidase (prepilin peptidase)/N-methyltransferase
MALFALWYLFVFVIGLAVGSFLNVCVARLPYEKSLIWPGSRCPACLQPVRWFDNIPLVSYLVLGGHCRSCQAAISWRYFAIELGTGLTFVALFHAEMVANVLDLPLIQQNQAFAPGFVPPEATVVFWHHAVLVSFLLAASLCDLMEMEIPLGITLWGTIVGLVLATLLPWPVPEQLPEALPLVANLLPPTRGVYAWPVWYPLPDWLPAGSWRLGLATGLAGALVGMILLRLIRFLFSLGRGIEGLGIGDAVLMMMAGAFVGWQPIVVAFIVGVFAGLFFALGQLFLRGQRSLPFGPSLSLGVVITILCWPGLGRALGPAMFDPILGAMVVITGAVSLLLVSFLLRLIG